MKKELKDFMYLYPNADMWVTRYTPRMFKCKEMIPEIEEDINDYDGEHLDKYKLVLRPISSITEEEIEGWNKISTPLEGMDIESGIQIHWAKRLNYYRSLGLDCDELISDGLAIDKTKIK